ncbi:tetratricopeptide repeat protein [Gracilinema caldarium]|uniref:tetratricopeptide repeat protein n=1 Tax=Gracilinema caldarium TaxID=215591 RepID=UPI0026F294EF|nr:tetratricopeptide repeat protein [Gracilinema caldarium]
MAGSLQTGIHLYRSKRWDAALNELLQVDTSTFSAEENAELAYFLGLCYTKLEQFDNALLYLEQVVTGASNPLRTYQCRMTLAYIYSITGRSKLAEFELQQLIEKGFESVQIYATMAYAAYAQKHYDEAIDLYQKALDLERDNPTALNGLGYILADTDRDIRRGLILCKKAVEKKPQNPAYMDSLGWAYFKNGEILEARTWLRRALDLLPQHPEIKQHMKTVLGAD